MRTTLVISIQGNHKQVLYDMPEDAWNAAFRALDEHTGMPVRIVTPDMTTYDMGEILEKWRGFSRDRDSATVDQPPKAVPVVPVVKLPQEPPASKQAERDGYFNALPAVAKRSVIQQAIDLLPPFLRPRFEKAVKNGVALETLEPAYFLFRDIRDELVAAAQGKRIKEEGE